MVVVNNEHILNKNIYYNFKSYLEQFAPKISHIDLISNHIWSYISIPENISDIKFRLYYEIINKDNWDIDTKHKLLSYDEFMCGFIYCVIDKFHSNIQDNTIVPNLRKDINYFNNIRKWNLYYNISTYCFVMINDIIIEIYNYIKKYIVDLNDEERNNYGYKEIFYSINFYNNCSSLNHILKYILSNYPIKI